MEDIQSKLSEEKAWWDKRKQGIQSSFMKELDDEAAGSTKGSVTSATNSRKGSVTSVAGQTEDAVLVEAPGSAKKKSNK
jgi:translocation protein SEC66